MPRQSASSFKDVFDHSYIGMAMIGPDGRWKEVNQSICDMLGYSRKELQQLTFQEITHPEDLEMDLQYLAELVAGKRRSYQLEKRYFHKNGSIVCGLLVVSMVNDGEGKLLHLISQVDDISERQKEALGLQEWEQQYKSLFERNLAAVFSVDLGGYITTANSVMAVKAEATIEQLIGLHYKEFVNPEDLHLADEGLEAVKTGEAREIKLRVYTLKGNELQINLVLLPVIVNKNISGAYALAHDITVDEHARQELEKAIHDLNLSNERYAYVTSATFDAIWDWDLKKNTLYWGEGYKTLFGYDTAEIAANRSTWYAAIHPEDLDEVHGRLSDLIAGNGTTWSAEYRYLKANGEYAFVIDKARIIRDDQGNGVRLIGAMQDITRKKSEEQQLKLFESVITNTNDGVIITASEPLSEPGPAIVYVNDAFTKMTGYTREEVIGKTPRILQGPRSDRKALATLRAAIERKENCEIETINYRKNGEEFWVNFSIVPMMDEKGWFSHCIAIARDITLRKRQEAEKELFFKLVQALGTHELGQAWIGILETICTSAGFDYAEAWMVNMDQSALMLHKTWSSQSSVKMQIIHDPFIKVKKGEGATGNAWANEAVSYCNDIAHDPLYLSNISAANSGLNSAVFIPIFFKGQVIAMLGLYSGKAAINDQGFKTLFDTISHQLGPYVHSKRAEDELARFFDLSPDFLAIAGTDGYFKKINPAFTRILGFSTEELFSKPISDFTHPDDRALTNLKRKNLSQGTALKNFENRYLTKDGETRWFSWTSTPLPEEGLIFAVAKETTEKRKLDEERKRILESISDFFFALDKAFNFTYMNSATEQLFNIVPGELIGKNIWLEKPSLRNSAFFTNVELSIASREPVSFEFYDEHAGTWFEESLYPSDDGLSVFFRSIHDRKAAEQALKQAFREKDTILESIGDAFFAVDKKWTVSYWNKRAEQLLFLNRNDIVGKNLWDKFPAAIPHSFYINYHRAIRENEAIHFEEYYAPLNIWLEVSAYPSHEGLSVYIKDISVRKEAEDAIRTSNERYDMVAKATNDAIWDWDLITNQVTRPGNRLETLFGHKGVEAAEVDDFWNHYTHPEDWEKVTLKRNALFANPNENFWEDEYRMLTTSGEYGYVYDKGYIIRNHAGKAIRMIGASQDITKEKKQVNEIIRIQQNLDSLINTTSDLIWSINTGFSIIAANKAFYDNLQLISGKTVNEGDNVLGHLNDTTEAGKWQQLYTKALAGETFHIEQSYYQPGADQLTNTIVSFSPIVDKDGVISGVACFAKDVTELKQAGEKLKDLNSSLEKRAAELVISNSELERFAYVASHDLQEPLRMVSSFLQLLERRYSDQLDETARKYIHFSVDGADRMKRLINDLLQYSRVGTASLEIVPVNMNEVLEEVLLLFRNEVHSIDAEIVVENLPVIYAGKSAISQLMQNLVGNALKYRRAQKPEVVISGREEDNEWIFTVQDNGIGIDQKYRDKIFIIFQRLHNKDEFNGTGIGLAICKKIIERYHGKIWVESEFGKGSKFIFTIPKRNN